MILARVKKHNPFLFDLQHGLGVNSVYEINRNPLLITQKLGINEDAGYAKKSFTI